MPDTLYAGTTDGLIWRTRDGGAHWTNVNTPNLPGRAVARLAVAADDPQTVYAVFGGFALQTPGAPGHVFQSSDGGATWADLTLNCPMRR